MNGRIAALIGAPYPRDREACRDMFGPRFQTITAWRTFLRCNLSGGSVASQLRAGPNGWSVKSFQALFIACWIHHPVEKGTFMIPLVDVMNLTFIRDALKNKLTSRPSSHLSGSGFSASQGWDFLKGYRELLVQVEDVSKNKGNPDLMLKAEGHATGISGVLPHLASMATKMATGEGNMASAALHEYANFSPSVEGRAAENYAKGYEALLEWLGLKGKFITVRELMFKLFTKVKWPRNTGHIYLEFDRATGAELGRQLKQYIAACRAPGGDAFRGGTEFAKKLSFKRDFVVSDKKLKELDELANTLVSDGDRRVDRTYKEVRARPADIDASVNYFCTQEDYPMPQGLPYL